MHILMIHGTAALNANVDDWPNDFFGPMNSISIQIPCSIAFGCSWVAALAGMLAHWTRVPYAVMLVLGGLLVERRATSLQCQKLDPNIFPVARFLPPLLFRLLFE